MILQSPSKEYVLIVAMQDCFYRDALMAMEDRKKDSRPIHAGTNRGDMPHNSNARETITIHVLKDVACESGLA